MAVPRKVSRHPLAKAWGAALALIGHLFLCALLVSGVWVLDRYMSYLWDHKDSMLFDKVPWRYLFDAVDGAIFAVFGFWGVLEAYKKLRGR